MTDRCGLGAGLSAVGAAPVGDTGGRDDLDGLVYPGELLVLTRPGAEEVGERGEELDEDDECRWV